MWLVLLSLLPHNLPLAIMLDLIYFRFNISGPYAVVLCIVSQLLFYILSLSHQRKLMVFHWSLSDNKSPKVFTTFLSILADLNNTVVWLVSTRPLISKSSGPFTNPLVTVPRVPITIGITVTFTFHSFFNSLARFR